MKRWLLKARKESERLTEQWWREHPAEREDALEQALRDEAYLRAKPLEEIRNTFCRAHITGVPCNCREHPDHAALALAFEPVARSLGALHRRQRELRCSVRDGYYRTIIRGMTAKGLLREVL
jgi:hypothetical protein